MIVTKESALKFLNTIHIPGLSGISARQDDEQWREKLVALLEGLECSNKREHPSLNIEDLIAHGKVADYHKLGKRILCRLRLLRKFLDEIEDGDVA